MMKCECSFPVQWKHICYTFTKMKLLTVRWASVILTALWRCLQSIDVAVMNWWSAYNCQDDAKLCRMQIFSSHRRRCHQIIKRHFSFPVWWKHACTFPKMAL
jgi:hypothetical protein